MSFRLEELVNRIDTLLEKKQYQFKKVGFK